MTHSTLHAAAMWSPAGSGGLPRASEAAAMLQAGGVVVCCLSSEVRQQLAAAAEASQACRAPALPAARLTRLHIHCFSDRQTNTVVHTALAEIAVLMLQQRVVKRHASMAGLDWCKQHCVDKPATPTCNCKQSCSYLHKISCLPTPNVWSRKGIDSDIHFQDTDLQFLLLYDEPPQNWLAARDFFAMPPALKSCRSPCSASQRAEVPEGRSRRDRYTQTAPEPKICQEVQSVRVQSRFQVLIEAPRTFATGRTFGQHHAVLSKAHICEK